VYASDLAALMVPVPHISEQKRIVEILEEHLSKLEKAFQELEVSIQGLNKLKQARLSSLFVGDSEPFPLVPLGQLGKWVTGSTPASANPNFVGNDVPFVTPGDIGYGGEIRTVRRKISNAGADSIRRLSSPSVQVVCIGATLGKVGFSMQEVTTNQQINSLLPDDSIISIGYASWLLTSPYVQSLLWKASSSTTVPILNKRTLESIEVPLPPKDKQENILREIENQASLSDSISQIAAESISKVELLRRSILNNAFPMAPFGTGV
jgi:type I restriction enzyme S subunit